MLRIHSPFHGAVLNRHHGLQRDDKLWVTVRGDCPPYGRVTVNGVPAEVGAGMFTAQIAISAPEEDIRARYEGTHGALEHNVRVVWDRHSFPRYRVALDDSSYFLRDIARGSYASIFECHYLTVLRRLHREYGAKFSCNLYLEADDGFSLAEFPERYRAEFAANADWLGLAFHARADKPDRPYQYGSPDALLADMDRVCTEVERFAGPEALIPPTVIHWGLVPLEALPRLYERGVRALSGYFRPTSYGWDVHYHLDDARAGHLWQNDCLKHWESGIVFSRVDIVVNDTPVDQVPGALAPLAGNPAHAEIMDLLTHEQYFWDFYPAYLPDHPERLECAIRWVTDHGYRPVFLHEGLLGAPAGA